MQQFRDPSVVRKVPMILSLTLGIRTSRPASLLLKGIMGSTVKRSTSPACFSSRRSRLTVLVCRVFPGHPSGGLEGSSFPGPLDQAVISAADGVADFTGEAFGVVAGVFGRPAEQTAHSLSPRLLVLFGFKLEFAQKAGVAKRMSAEVALVADEAVMDQGSVKFGRQPELVEGFASAFPMDAEPARQRTHRHMQPQASGSAHPAFVGAEHRGVQQGLPDAPRPVRAARRLPRQSS